MNLIIPGWESVLQMLIAMCSVICIGGAILLLLHAEGSRSKRLLAYVMLAWGIAYAIRIFGLLFGFMGTMESSVLAPFVLITGNLYAIITLFYPLEVVRPGWLTPKRCLLVMSPYLVIVAFYFAVMYLLGETPVRLAHWDTLPINMGQFNVWYRLVIVFSVFAYIAYLILIVYRHEVSYRQWCDANYASTEDMEISWLRFYGLGTMFIMFAFCWILLDGNTYCYVAHNIIVQLFFGFIFYKGFFHENPYPENFFRHTMNEEEARENEEVEKLPPPPVVDDAEQQEKSMNETVFLVKLPEYTTKVQQWMEETKPYLRKDFKLMDVAGVLPLNRTYLSQIFNEGWGESFSDVVRSYRIHYAEELLRNHPGLTVNQVALKSGFTSPSALHRAFAQYHDGITPKQYREKENSG